MNPGLKSGAKICIGPTALERRKTFGKRGIASTNIVARGFNPGLTKKY
jgi:hypothetical protein